MYSETSLLLNPLTGTCSSTKAAGWPGGGALLVQAFPDASRFPPWYPPSGAYEPLSRDWLRRPCCELFWAFCWGVPRRIRQLLFHPNVRIVDERGKKREGKKKKRKDSEGNWRNIKFQCIVVGIPGQLTVDLPRECSLVIKGNVNVLALPPCCCLQLVGYSREQRGEIVRTTCS